MMDEFKTQVISFDKTKENESVTETKQVVEAEKPSIRNVLFNVTTRVPVVEESLPVTQVKEQEEKKIELKSVEKINKNYKSFPKFYTQELHRFARLFYIWIAIVALTIGLETWAMVAIAKAPVSNWTMLTMIPFAGLSIAFLIVYANNYFNYRNEAKNVDFSKEKIVTVNVSKLYRRLKTAHINVNWFCSLTYAASCLTILGTYIGAWIVSRQWGNLDPSLFKSGLACKIIVIVSICAIFIAFFLHIYLLVTNYTRASKIDQFYGTQIVAEEELALLKKKKMQRDAIIFAAVIMILVLIGFLIYRLIKNRKVNNTVTINNK